MKSCRPPSTELLRVAESSSARVITFLARRRVPLGFITALATAILARPTWRYWTIGLLVALVGEAIRVWAAGHLEKGREVTRSGPYRWTAHPLYVGSSIIAVGVVVAANSVLAALLAAVYMTATLAAAVRTEEAFLRGRFGGAYEAYRRSEGADMNRRFSLARALRNKEYRAVVGLLIGFGFLALRVSTPI